MLPLKLKEWRKGEDIGISSENAASLPATARGFGDAALHLDQYGDIYLWRTRCLPVVYYQQIFFFPLTFTHGIIKLMQHVHMLRVIN